MWSNIETIHRVPTPLGPVEVSVYDDRLFVGNANDEATGTVPLQGDVVIGGSLSIDGSRWLEQHFFSLRSTKMFGRKLSDEQISQVKDTIRQAVANFVFDQRELVQANRVAASAQKADKMRSQAADLRRSAAAYLKRAEDLEAAADAAEESTR